MRIRFLSLFTSPERPHLLPTSLPPSFRTRKSRSRDWYLSDLKPFYIFFFFWLNSTLDLDLISITSGFTIKESTTRGESKEEDQLMVIDNHQPSDHLSRSGWWWSDRRVVKELKLIWSPNQNLQSELHHLQWILHPHSQIPAHRLWLARTGSHDSLKLKMISVLPYSEYYSTGQASQAHLTSPTNNILNSSSMNLNSRLGQSEIVVLFGNQKEYKDLKDKKHPISSLLGSSKIFITPKTLSQAYSNQFRGLSSLSLQAGLVLRDLFYASQVSDQIVCHTLDMNCRFLFLISSFKPKTDWLGIH